MGVVSLLILGHFIVTAAFSAAVPLGEAPDEADHWAYIVYLAENRALPVGPTVTQSKHPPLYHATAALFALLGDPSERFLRANPDVQFAPPPDASVKGWSPNFFIHTSLEDWPWQGGALAFRLARLWSIIISTLTVWAFYGLARTVLPADRPWWLIGAVGAAAFWPEFSFIGGMANNDNAAALFGTLALWGAFAIYRADGRLAAGWWTPLAVGFGLLSKVSTVGVWPAVGLAILFGVIREAQRTGTLRSPKVWVRTVVVKGLIVFGVGLLIASPWLVRNWLLYGDPLGLEMASQTVDLRLTPWTWADTVWLLRGWFLSFWGKFGAIGHIAYADWVYTLLGLISAIAALGLLRIGVAYFVGWRKRAEQNAFPAPMLLGLLLIAVLSVGVVMWRYSLLALGTDQGRLLYPALAAIVLLFVIGLFAWIPRQHDRTAALVLTGGMMLLSVGGLVLEVIPAFAPPQPLTAEAVSSRLADQGADASVPIKPPIQFGELTLIGWMLEPSPTLYWQAAEKPTAEWRTVLRVTAEDGTLIWERKRSPAAGRWATDRWGADVVVADGYEIGWPETIGAGRYRVEVGLQPFGGELVAPTEGSQLITNEGHQLLQLGWVIRD